MIDVIGVCFKPDGKLYYFDPMSFDIKKDDLVIVETARGQECGRVVTDTAPLPAEDVIRPLKPVVRIATEEDQKRYYENRESEAEARTVFEEKVLEHKLEMKLVDVEYAFDRSKLLFYFTAEGRVDFRDLVKDLATIFRTRIELRQIGVRDEAKMVGGLGICGRPFCCSSFLDDFHPVSIRMAKDQGLSLNPTKISGMCGRLMCCLKYEEDSYRALHKAMPSVGSVVSTREGEGKVVDINLLQAQVKVSLFDRPEGVPITFNRKDIQLVQKRNNKNKAVIKEKEVQAVEDDSEN